MAIDKKYQNTDVEQQQAFWLVWGSFPYCDVGVKVILATETITLETVLSAPIKYLMVLNYLILQNKMINNCG